MFFIFFFRHYYSRQSVWKIITFYLSEWNIFLNLPPFFAQVYFIVYIFASNFSCLIEFSWLLVFNPRRKSGIFVFLILVYPNKNSPLYFLFFILEFITQNKNLPKERLICYFIKELQIKYFTIYAKKRLI